MEQSVIINQVLLALDDKLVPGSVRIRGKTITHISIGSEIKPDRDTVISGNHGILAPGFIDLHCHGGRGGDLNDGTPKSFFKMEEFHRRNGVTSFMPTLSVDPMEKLDKACAMVRSLSEQDLEGRPEILGIHFESPYINPLYRGCQAEDRILGFDKNAMDFIEKNADIISRITLAPELPGVLEGIPKIREKNILVSGGHSAAPAELFRAAADRGMTMATHLYNAMSQVHKEGPFRIPGVLEAALTDDRIYTECIADGYHLPPELLQIAYRCKGPDKFMICSDASRAAGYTGKDTLFICGQEAIVENGVAMTKDRTSLASSAASLGTMVRFLVNKGNRQLKHFLREGKFAW
ncbi:N-acetylglucosamine-6-phosphate deacetylase [Spirochaetia bacterium]|nr:N-acetylglucosamine-6-phosphate deacetylase [Spirochaetia bacterium]